MLCGNNARIRPLGTSAVKMRKAHIAFAVECENDNPFGIRIVHNLGKKAAGAFVLAAERDDFVFGLG
jgi:hypothetical protein